MGQPYSYTCPDNPWNFVPTAFALIGITIGYTAYNKLYIMFCYIFLLMVGLFNYLDLLPGVTMNWMSFFSPDQANFFGEICLVAIIIVSLSISTFLVRKNYFGICMYKAGDCYEVINYLGLKDQTGNYIKVKKVSKMLDFKPLTYWSWTLLQTIPPLAIFQLFLWRKIDCAIPSASPFPWSVICGAILYVIFFLILGLLWFYVIWPSIDNKFKMIMSLYYHKEYLTPQGKLVTKDRRIMYLWYLLYFTAMYVVFHIIQVMFMYIPWNSLYPTTFAALIITVINFIWSARSYLVWSKNECKKYEKMDSTEEPTEKELMIND
jgi:hypothetical protein